MESSRLRNLAEAFVVSAASSQSASSYVSYGWWTKRINICPNFLRGDRFEHLVTLLEHCYNLEILSIGVASDPVTSETHFRLLRLLESRFSPSFRRLDNYLNLDDADADVTPCISGLRSLSVLMQNDTPNPLAGRAFESVTTLTMYFPDFIGSLPSQWTFPALKNLSLWNFASRDIEALTPFVKRHQDTLLHLHISTTTGSTNYDLHHVFSNAPNINSLALEKVDLGSLEQWSQINPSSDSHLLPKLAYLGISYDNNKPDAYPWTDNGLVDVLRGGLFPNLKVIRLLSEYNPTSSESVWSNMVEQCTESGVRLEDRRGVLIRLN